MENQPILKKIRRPINRAMPLTSPEVNKEPEMAQQIKTNDYNNHDAEPLGIKNQYAQPQPQPQPQVNLPSVQNVPTTSYRQSNYEDTEPQYLNEDEYMDEVYGDGGNQQGVSVKALVFSIMVCLLLGLLAGRFLFSEKQVTQNGLQGVVINSEIPRGRARCGVAERTQGCVLYLMNPQRQNVRVKDFYDMAAQVTGRQRFMIETGNMRYSNTEIRPGDIAQNNIPPL